MSKRFRVVIVGGGPVGMAMAIELGQRGISCAIVEPRTVPHRIPKGQGLTQRSMEHFYRWGVADKVRSVRVLPPGFSLSGVTAYLNLSSEYWYSPPFREVVNSYYFQDSERVPQYLTEGVLQTRMAELSNVHSLVGWTGEAIEQDDAGVRVGIVSQGGERMVLEAEYAVGCDGSHSNVRAQVGIERDRQDFDQLMVILEQYDPHKDREAFERAWEKSKTDTPARAMTYDPHYEGSSVVFGPPGSVCSARGTHTFTARSGHHLPSRLLSNERNVFEALGREFTLLAFDAGDSAVAMFKQASAKLGVPLTVVRDNYGEGREAYKARFILVRPDHYIAWTGDDAPDSAMAVIAKAVARAGTL